VCHVPPGNPDNAHTISVSAKALPAHLAHGDQEGECRAVVDQGPRAFVWHTRETAPSPFPAATANPFRGRMTQSRYTATGAVNRRYYAGSADLAALPAGDPLRSLLWVGDDPSEGYTERVDPFPPTLESFWSDDFYFRAPKDDAWFFTGGIPQSSPAQKLGGDYSGTAQCVQVDLRDGTGAWNFATGVISGSPIDPAFGLAKCDPTRGCPGTPGAPVETGQGCGPGLTSYCEQLAGQAHHAGCISFGNTRVTGGSGELPLRPAPDLSNVFTPVAAGVAQGLAFPPPASPVYERRIDLATGEPLVARNAIIPDDAAIRAPANRDPHDYASMSSAGIGRGPAHLKPGGSAAGLNQNGFTVARNAAGEVLYYRTDEHGNPRPGPASRFITNGDDTWYPLFDFQPIACAGADEFPDCRPMRYEVGLAEDSSNGQLFAEGWSPQNALENHPADQGLFACICDAQLQIAEAPSDPGACAFNFFGSPTLLERSFLPFPLVEIASCLLAGEIGATCNGLMNSLSNTLQGDMSRRESGIVPLNRDPNDGLITATANLVNRDQKPITGTSLAAFIFANGTLLPGDEDMLTLDSALTIQQRGLVGCGPLFGTRCDSSLRASGGPFGINLCTAFGVGCTEGGGIDLLNTAAPAVLQATVGLEGTDLADPVYTSNPQHPAWAQWAAGGVNFAGSAFAADGLWLATSGLPQPGTMEFAIGPVCTGVDPESNETVILPGCRGINAVLNRETARQDGDVVFRFDDGFDVHVDGCPLGQAIDGVPVRGVYGDGSPVDLGPCFESTHKVGGFYAWRVGNSDASHPGQAQPSLIDWDFRPPSTSQARLSRPGSATLWHPYAGCFADPAQAVAGGECVSVPYEDIADIADPASPNYNPLLAARLANGGGSFDPVSGRYRGGTQIAGDVPRDFEAAFFLPSGEINVGGTSIDGFNLQSQIFRSEMAALSFNFTQLLVQSSCDRRFDDIFTQAECFDPNNQFAVGKCSYATPQLCRNVKILRGLTLPLPPEESSVPEVCRVGDP
jgi:hypothetical protein